MSCDCYTIGGPFIAEDPDCPEHGWEAQKERERHEIKLEGLNQRIRFLEAELDALRADAERYRWLSTEHDRIDPLAAVVWKSSGDRHGSQWCNTINAEDLARSIDAQIAAIAAKEPNRE